MTKPIDVPTRETASFIGSHVTPGATVLEVGCGEGHVALELVRRGYQVTGLDSDRDVVVRARARGVDAVQATWPGYDGGRVNAIAFTRSLHHINPLHAAIEQAHELLKPEGTLLVEDFAFDEMNPATIQWFLQVLRSPTGRALIVPTTGEFATTLLAADDPVAAWLHDHAHELHTAPAMMAAVSEHFALNPVPSVPYLYRYLLPVLPETAEAAAFVDAVFNAEARAAQRGQILWLGRRIAGSLHKHGSTG